MGVKSEVITVESNAFRQIVKRLDYMFDLLTSDIDAREMQQLLDTNQLVAELKISKSTASRLRKAGEISYFKNGRKILYYKADMQKYLDAHRKENINIAA